MQIKDIKEKMRLTTNDEETYIYVVPIDNLNYITYPIEDLTKAVPICLEDFVKLRFGLVCFSDDLKKIVPCIEETEKE